MAGIADFAEVLDAVERLDPEAQAELVAVVGRRLAERGRAGVAERVAEARREVAAGLGRPVTAAEILSESTH